MASLDGSLVRRNKQYWFEVKKNPTERQELDRLWGSDDDDSSDDGARKVAEAIVHAEAQKWLGKTSSRRSFLLESTRYVDAPIFLRENDNDNTRLP